MVPDVIACPESGYTVRAVVHYANAKRFVFGSKYVMIRRTLEDPEVDDPVMEVAVKQPQPSDEPE